MGLLLWEVYIERMVCLPIWDLGRCDNSGVFSVSPPPLLLLHLNIYHLNTQPTYFSFFLAEQFVYAVLIGRIYIVLFVLPQHPGFFFFKIERSNSSLWFQKFLDSWTWFIL